MFKRVLHSKAAWNTLLSYASFVTTSAWAIITIPIAVHYLDKEELGLWSVVSAVLSYLIWMDLGVGAATGRLIADSVVAKDQVEINRWWTLTRVTLYVQAFVMLLVGAAVLPLVIYYMAPSEGLIKDAWILLGGGILVTALFFPVRGIGGLLTAQHRFHWGLTVQIASPWANLAAFVALLRMGYGLKAYLGALFFSQGIAALLYYWFMWIGPNRPRWDSKGIQKKRFKKLFGFSYKTSVYGLVESILKTLPNVLLARLGGLPIVPIYNFSSKGPLLGTSLASRTYQAFYPGLLQRQVGGKRTEFLRIYKTVGLMTVGMCSIGAACVLCLNESMVLFLTSPEFYPGATTNIWFAVSIVTMPLSGLLLTLNFFSGELDRLAWIALFKLAVSAVAGVIGWKLWGLAGIAAAFAVTPLIGGSYGYFNGGRRCADNIHQLSGLIVLVALVVIGLTIVCGVFYPAGWDAPKYVTIFSRQAPLPSYRQILSITPLLLSGFITLFLGVLCYRGHFARCKSILING